MRLILSIGAIAIISYALLLFLPWWIIAVGAFIVGAIFSETGVRAFLSGLIGIFLLWLIHALLIDIYTDFILSEKIAEIFFLPSPILLIIIASLIGGVVGGMGALSGYLFKKLI